MPRLARWESTEGMTSTTNMQELNDTYTMCDIISRITCKFKIDQDGFSQRRAQSESRDMGL